MEDRVEEKRSLLRVDVERRLRSYRSLEKVLSSADTFFADVVCKEAYDEASIRAQMHSIRAMISLIDDPQERMLLYQHYINGASYEKCARLLGTSPRTVYRLRNRAIEKLANKNI